MSEAKRWSVLRSARPESAVKEDVASGESCDIRCHPTVDEVTSYADRELCGTQSPLVTRFSNSTTSALAS